MTIYLLTPLVHALRISMACGFFLLLLDTTIAYTPLSDDKLRGIPSGGNDFDVHNGSLLAPILIERSPGTEGSARVQQHFVDFFTRDLPEWVIEWHNSTSTTPATGNHEVPFRNLILRRDPPSVAAGNVSRLTLAAHYDSLRKSGFVGATDSAASCAILMHVARSIDNHLQRKWYANSPGGLDLGEKGVQILFLDGEEAFSHWTATDSLYGARALAEAWENTFYQPTSIYHNRMDSISLFVLLDLLGAQAPYVPSFFQNTHWAYQHMAAIEDRMRSLGLLESSPRSNFLSDATKTIVSHALRILARFFLEDDHIPFLRRGVDILHLIPIPFPSTWHTLQDDGEHLHSPTVRDWSKILTAFTMEWMDLEDVALTAAAKTKPTKPPIDKTEL